MGRQPIGDHELEVLQYVSDHAPITVREVTEHYGKPRGLARTTILTVMERLRKKKYIRREKIEDTYHYSPCMPKRELLRGLLEDFTQRVLGGSVQPLVAYLAQDAQLNEEELDKLQDIINTKRHQPKEEDVQ
ncbi:MAG: BlaI/MecI/CopY family transcriptional regulator [Armatimonadota bacterium]